MDRREKFQHEISCNPFVQVSDLVYQYLFEDIIGYRIKPGSYINTNQLAKELGLSRTPVQTAIQRLCDDHLVERKNGKSPYVIPIKIDEYRKIVNIRMAVEGDAAYYASKHITDVELVKLHEIIKEMETLYQSPPIKMNPNKEQMFHTIIVEASRNEYFIKAYQLYQNALYRYRCYLAEHCPYNNETFIQNLNTHKGIYSALKLRLSSQAKNEVLFDINQMSDILIYIKE